MKYVLDTNALSALMKGDDALTKVLASIASVDVGVPQPALAEIAFGLARLPKSRRKTLLEDRFALVRAEIQSVPWTDSVSEAFGDIKAKLEKDGHLIEDFDIAIAAHAVALKATLLSNNTKHMKRIRGLALESWRG